MAKKEKKEIKKKDKRRLGDRKDAKLIRDIDSLHLTMALVYDKRTSNEAYIAEEIELQPLYDWINKQNSKLGENDFKYTFFHIIVAVVLCTQIQRPKLNIFIKNKKYFQRNDVSTAFIVKRQMTEQASEAMAIIKANENTTIFDVYENIKNVVLPARSGKNSNTEDALDFLAKLPGFLQKFIFAFILWFDKHGWLPKDLTENDANHCSSFITNLGSIKLNCGYHHLANWGTNSMFVVVGEKKSRPKFDENGNVTMRDTLRIGLTIDERIADGYYYSKSVKLMKKLFENPELLEKPFGEKIEF